MDGYSKSDSHSQQLHFVGLLCLGEVQLGLKHPRDTLTPSLPALTLDPMREGSMYLCFFNIIFNLTL